MFSVSSSSTQLLPLVAILYILYSNPMFGLCLTIFTLASIMCTMIYSVVSNFTSAVKKYILDELNDGIVVDAIIIASKVGKLDSKTIYSGISKESSIVLNAIFETVLKNNSYVVNVILAAGLLYICKFIDPYKQTIEEGITVRDKGVKLYNIDELVNETDELVGARGADGSDGGAGANTTGPVFNAPNGPTGPVFNAPNGPNGPNNNTDMFSADELREQILNLRNRKLRGN